MPKASRAISLFPCAKLASIRALDVVGRQHGFKWLEWVLRGCPNITTIAFDLLPDHWAHIRSMLADAATTGQSVLSLRKLIVRSISSNTTLSLQQIVAQIGAEMVCLEICCLINVSPEDLCVALQTMHHLQELTLQVTHSARLFDGPTIVTALQSCASLHKLHLMSTRLENTSKPRATLVARLYAAFAFVLEACSLCPALKCLRVGPFIYNNTTSHLQLDGDAITEAHIRRVLNAVGGKVTSLTMLGSVAQDVMIAKTQDVIMFVCTTWPTLLLSAGTTALRIVNWATLLLSILAFFMLLFTQHSLPAAQT